MNIFTKIAIDNLFRKDLSAEEIEEVKDHVRHIVLHDCEFSKESDDFIHFSESNSESLRVFKKKIKINMDNKRHETFLFIEPSTRCHFNLENFRRNLHWNPMIFSFFTETFEDLTGNLTGIYLKSISFKSKNHVNKVLSQFENLKTFL